MNHTWIVLFAQALRYMTLGFLLPPQHNAGLVCAVSSTENTNSKKLSFSSVTVWIFWISDIFMFMLFCLYIYVFCKMGKLTPKPLTISLFALHFCLYSFEFSYFLKCHCLATVW